jgi:hypothetical protein
MCSRRWQNFAAALTEIADEEELLQEEVREKLNLVEIDGLVSFAAPPCRRTKRAPLATACKRAPGGGHEGPPLAHTSLTCHDLDHGRRSWLSPPPLSLVTCWLSETS